MKEALKATEMATQHQVKISSLTDLNEKQKELVIKQTKGEIIVLYELPGRNICVPTMSEDDISFTHVMKGKVS